MALPSLFLFVIPLIIFLFFLKKHHLGLLLRARGQHLPPGPNSLYVLTYLPQLIHKPHKALQELAHIYGPLMSFRLGDQLVVVASSPETAKQFCTTHGRTFSGRHLPSVYHHLPGTTRSSIVLAPDCNKPWKLLRSIGQTCIFSAKAGARARKSKVETLVNHLRCREGEVADLEGLIFATLANIVSDALTSSDLIDIDGPAAKDAVTIDLINEVIEKTTTFGVVDFLPILKLVDFWSKGKAMGIHGIVKRTWGRIIDERKITTTSSTRDFLDIVLDDGTFSDDQIGNALIELLIGATDTVSITTVWLMVELMRNQEMLSKVRDEIAQQAAEGDELDEARLSECRYFEACVKETLRLHVPAPMLVPHRAVETSKVNNYVIPKDSMVLVNAWAIARDPDYWGEDATRFKPERFLDSEIGHMGTHYEYLPFGAGLRMCPGSGVAFKNIEMLVGSLLHCFDWSLPNGADPSTIDTNDKYFTTLKRAEPLLLIPKSRN